MSFRWIAPFSGVIAVVFAVLFVSDRRRAAESTPLEPAAVTA